MRLAILGMTALALAACGDKKTEKTMTTADGSTIKVEQKNGEAAAKITATSANGTATITTGGAGQWPAGLADYAPAYPGGQVGASFSGSSNDGAGGMVTFTTSDSPDKVVDFYKAHAAAAGLTDVSNMDINGAKMFGAKDSKTGRSLSIQASIADGKTTAAVTFGSDKK
ncbi:MAG: hypothetical protein K2P79_04675 [Sphingomonas sp.]|nr:hypothetical protein [Sphingomonas sp.]